jgi:hypothetical protein
VVAPGADRLFPPSEAVGTFQVGLLEPPQIADLLPLLPTR